MWEYKNPRVAAYLWVVVRLIVVLFGMTSELTGREQDHL